MNNCRYCHNSLFGINENITQTNPSGYKRVFHWDCFFLALGVQK